MSKKAFSQRQKFVRTKLELSRLLGVARGTWDTYTTLPGCPQVEARGWPLEACRAFVAGQLGRNEERRALELQKLRDEVARGQIELMKKADEVMPVEWVEKVLDHLVISFRQIIQGSTLTDEQKETMTNAVLAIDMDKFIDALGRESGAGGDGGSNEEEA